MIFKLGNNPRAVRILDKLAEDFSIDKEKLLKGLGYEVEIRRIKQKRSLDQNALHWLQARALGKFAGYTEREMSDTMLIELWGGEERTFKGRTITVPNKRTSKLTKDEFGELLDLGARWCAESGVTYEQMIAA